MDENFGGRKLVYFQYIMIVIGGKSYFDGKILQFSGLILILNDQK